MQFIDKYCLSRFYWNNAVKLVCCCCHYYYYYYYSYSSSRTVSACSVRASLSLIPKLFQLNKQRADKLSGPWSETWGFHGVLYTVHTTKKQCKNSVRDILSSEKWTLRQVNLWQLGRYQLKTHLLAKYWRTQRNRGVLTSTCYINLHCTASYYYCYYNC